MKNSLLLLLLLLGNTIYAQKSEEVIKSFDEIPKVVQEQIMEDLLSFKKTDTLTTRLVDSLSRDTRYIFSYSLRKEGNQLKGIFNEKYECDNCMLDKNFWSYNLNLQYVYCCKDPDHDPAEVELTPEKMKKTQKEKGCKEIGVCFMK